MSAETSRIYEAIIMNPDKIIKIPVENKTEFETIRRNLYRHHKQMVEIGGTADSLVCIFMSQLSQGWFRFKDRLEKKSYEILIEDPP